MDIRDVVKSIMETDVQAFVLYRSMTNYRSSVIITRRLNELIADEPDLQDVAVALAIYPALKWSMHGADADVVMSRMCKSDEELRRLGNVQKVLVAATGFEPRFLLENRKRYFDACSELIRLLEKAIKKVGEYPNVGKVYQSILKLFLMDSKEEPTKYIVNRYVKDAVRLVYECYGEEIEELLDVILSGAVLSDDEMAYVYHNIRNILLRGEPGTGKTEMYVGIAAGCHLPLYTFAANAMTEPFDMYGQFVPVDENGNQIGDKIPLTKVLSGLPSAQDMSMDPVMSYQEITGVFKENATPVDCMAAAFNLAQKSLNVGDGKQRFKFVPGQLIYAMKNGGVWGFDEVTLPMNPGVVPTLNPAMDNTQSITLPTGEIVRRHPDCIFVGTTNIDLEGCRNMNQAWQDRCQLIIDLPEPTDEVLLERLKAMVDFDQVPDAASIDLKRFVSAYKQLKEIAKKKRLDDGVIGPRKLADWVQSFLWVTRDPILSAEITIIPGATSDAGGISELRQKIQDLFK